MWDFQSILLLLSAFAAVVLAGKVIYNWSNRLTIIMFFVLVLMAVVLELSKHYAFLGNIVDCITDLLGG